MKIKISAISLLTLCFAAETAFANVIATPDTTSNSVDIYGTVLHDKIQLLLLKPGYGVSDVESAAASLDKTELGNVVEYYEQITVKGDNIETSIPMRADAAKGKYTLVVDNEVYSLYYADVNERLTNMVPNAKAALTGGTFETFVSGDAKYFCDSRLLEDLSDTDKVAKYSADILDEFKNSSDSDFMSKLPSALNMGIVMEALNENKTDDFYIVKSMTDSSGMTVPLDKADLIREDKINNVTSDVSGKDFSSTDEYKRLLSESIFMNVLYNASNMNNENKKGFFETYAQQLGLDLTEYNKLTANKRTEAIAKLFAAEGQAFSALQGSLDTVCKSIPTSTTPGAAGGGGGGGAAGDASAGGAITIRAGNNDTEPTETINNNGNENANGNTSGGLSDLSECKWAQPAIEYLIGIGMINGYEDNTFKPFRNISRAEFITIIARKYLPSETYTQTFSDVKTDSWCFDYIESAYNNGIINGKGNDIFAPNENISRQDMASILYRLAVFLGSEISGVSTEFSDDEDIADYAKDAIYNLRSVGIVNGYEDGRFDPRAVATRAEAVQMIYNFIQFLE